MSPSGFGPLVQRWSLGHFGAALGLASLFGCGGAPEPSPWAEFLAAAESFTPVPPPPRDSTNRFEDSEAAARLGQRLFFEPGLSGNGKVACATCHIPSHHFSDPRPHSDGMGPGERHAPTLLLAAHHHWFGWGGRADSLWSQALGPLEHSHEMGGNRVAIARFVAADPTLASAYAQVFGETLDPSRWPTQGLPAGADPDGDRSAAVASWEAMDPADQERASQAFANIGKALAAYERRLLPGPAPFDLFVAELQAGRSPDPARFPEAAQRGFELFRGAAGCVVCHSGPIFSDGEFHNTGAPPSLGLEPTDAGRYADAKDLTQSSFWAGGSFSDDPNGQRAERTRLFKIGSEQWGEFKTPSLRNLLGRAPYMHEGQFSTLEEVLHFYDTREGAVGSSHHQEQILRPLGLTPVQRADLLAFLGTLEGAPVPKEWSQNPAQ